MAHATKDFCPVMADLAAYERQQDRCGHFCDRVNKIVEELLAGDFNPATPENISEALANSEVDVFQLKGSQIADIVFLYWNDAAEDLAVKIIDEEDERAREAEEQARYYSCND